MKTIKFSNEHKKLPTGALVNTVKTELIQVLIVDKKDLSERFVRYDTIFHTYQEQPNTEREQTVENFYPLPKGKLLLLFLFSTHPPLKDTGNLWTTLRRWTPDKEKYYRHLVGQQINIEVNRDDV